MSLAVDFNVLPEAHVSPTVDSNVLSEVHVSPAVDFRVRFEAHVSLPPVFAGELEGLGLHRTVEIGSAKPILRNDPPAITEQ